MKLNYFIPVFLVVFAFTSCKNDTKKETPETVEVTSGDEVTQSNSKKPTIGDVAFNDPKMAVVFREYLGLKDALVGTNAAQAGASAARLVTAFATMDEATEASKAAKNIVEASNIEEQRTAFVPLTSAVEAMLDGEIASGTIYKQYCPMAFDNTGASWLSGSSDIMNPYFGDKMLRCGRIDGKIE
tara:strand:- start:20237 stop:20791 length:555 start_codon:yes stop_codon:yes gene_type:complete